MSTPDQADEPRAERTVLGADEIVEGLHAARRERDEQIDAALASARPEDDTTT